MKKFRWLYSVLLLFLLGFFYTALIYNGIWFKITSGLKSVSILGYFLWFFFTFYLTLTLHELGHFFAFFVQKIKLRALYLTIFVFFRDQKGWHFTIKPKLWILLGGLVVPELEEIKSDADYDQLKNRFANALIVAPIVTVVFMVLSIISFIFILIYSQSTQLIGISTLLSIYITLLSSLYIYTFTLSNQMFYGDFVAYKKMKTDPVFQLAQINQYTMFSLEESELTTRYLWEKSRTALLSIDLNTSIFHTMLLINYIDGILHMNYEVDQVVDQKIRGLKIANYTRSEQGLSLAYDICYYFYQLKEVEKAYHLFETIRRKASKKLDHKMTIYLEKKSSHIMHIAYHEAFLEDEKNVYIGNSWIFEALINPYEMLKNDHEQLPFVPYTCPVVLKELEEQKSDLN